MVVFYESTPHVYNIITSSKKVGSLENARDHLGDWPVCLKSIRVTLNSPESAFQDYVEATTSFTKRDSKGFASNKLAPEESLEDFSFKDCEFSFAMVGDTIAGQKARSALLDQTGTRPVTVTLGEVGKPIATDEGTVYVLENMGMAGPRKSLYSTEHGSAVIYPVGYKISFYEFRVTFRISREALVPGSKVEPLPAEHRILESWSVEQVPGDIHVTSRGNLIVSREIRSDTDVIDLIVEDLSLKKLYTVLLVVFSTGLGVALATMVEASFRLIARD